MRENILNSTKCIIGPVFALSGCARICKINQANYEKNLIALFATAISTTAALPINAPVATNAYITKGGYDVVWAGPQCPYSAKLRRH